MRWIWGLVTVVMVAAVSAEEPWPAGVRMTANAWVTESGDIEQGWRSHESRDIHRSYYQVLYCDVPEHAQQRAQATAGLRTGFKRVRGLRFSETEADALVAGDPLWEEFCSLDLYALGLTWIELNLGPRGLYRKWGKAKARKFAAIGKPQGLTAVEYVCAYELRNPPAALVAAIRATDPGSSVKWELRHMQYDPEDRLHRERRAAWAYYGVDHAVLCEGMG